MPSTGNVKILAMLIEFTDQAHSNSRADIHARLFGPADATRPPPYDSLAEYYSRASYNQLDLHGGNTLDWYQAPYARSTVPQTTTGRENLIKEVLNHYDAQGHDFSQYDNNNDGTIDYFVVIWTGPDNGWANFWWGYQTTFSDAGYMLDGKRLGRYSWQWEANPIGGTFNPIVVIHETGHALGLPDYYDYDPNVGPDGGLGGLDMMDANRGDHNCFSKWMLEWLTPTVIASGTQTRSLNASGVSQDCVVIWPGLTTGDLFTEYFVVQNRHRVANDAGGMPGDGMLIWHVDAHLNAAGADFSYDNSFTAHKLIRVMEADGLEEIEQNGVGDAGDYYAAGRSFGPSTTPSSARYDGTPSNVEVTNFSAAGSVMTATFSIQGIAATVPACSLCYTCGGNWPAFSGVIPLQAGVQPWERDSACSGNLTPRADSYPYLCCKLQP
jgi:M6 family metalloprotease-like protein